MWPLPERGLHRRLGSVQAASLVIHGEQDALVPKVYAKEFADRLSGAKLQLIAQAGHFPMIEQQDAFMSSVSAFLA
jgi:pimeloyl-ACP methyl ester carboxylesterase